MIVIKVGGSEGISYDAVCADIAELQQQELVLVHGGSHLTNQVADALGHPPQFVTSPSGYTSRLTDRRTLEIFEMVYCGQVNKGIVEKLQQLGVNAIGLSGIDGGLWRGPRKMAIREVNNGRQRIIRNNFTGRVDVVNVKLLNTLLDAGYTPVLTPPAISTDGDAINVDGDRAAAATAIALAATDLLILSNVAGVLRQSPDPTTMIPSIASHHIKDVSEMYAQGRMRIKLRAAAEAIEGGVERVVIGDAVSERPIFRALDGHGTVIK